MKLAVDGLALALSMQRKYSSSIEGKEWTETLVVCHELLCCTVISTTEIDMEAVCHINNNSLCNN